MLLFLFLPPQAGVGKNEEAVMLSLRACTDHLLT
jgi:hypothetical protein